MSKFFYYEVFAKCGHVGKNNYIEITFPVRAKNKKEAAAKTCNFPRVKHNHKDAFRSVKEVSYDKYQELLENYREDNYNFCHSKQHQRMVCGDEIYARTYREPEEKDYRKIKRETRILRKKKYYKIINNEYFMYINSLIY